MQWKEKQMKRMTKKKKKKLNTSLNNHRKRKSIKNDGVKAPKCDIVKCIEFLMTETSENKSHRKAENGGMERLCK